MISPKGPFFCKRWMDKCYDLLRKRYKFYLSFENSNCRYYSREILYQRLEVSLILWSYIWLQLITIVMYFSYLNIWVTFKLFLKFPKVFLNFAKKFFEKYWKLFKIFVQVFYKFLKFFINFFKSLCWVMFCWMFPPRTEILATPLLTFDL